MHLLKSGLEEGNPDEPSPCSKFLQPSVGIDPVRAICPGDAIEVKLAWAGSDLTATAGDGPGTETLVGEALSVVAAFYSESADPAPDESPRPENRSRASNPWLHGGLNE